MNTQTVTKTVTAIYQTSSVWNIDFDLEGVHEYWIKWDTVFVVHNEGDDAIEYSPDVSAEDDHEAYKQPLEVVVE